MRTLSFTRQGVDTLVDNRLYKSHSAVLVSGAQIATNVLEVMTCHVLVMGHVLTVSMATDLVHVKLALLELPVSNVHQMFLDHCVTQNVNVFVAHVMTASMELEVVTVIPDSQAFTAQKAC
jgi:hypothetical protein